MGVRRVAALNRSFIPGEINLLLEESICATFGRANFPITIPARTVIEGAARLIAFRQTVMGCMVSPEMFGSGAPTGSIHRFRLSPRFTTQSGRQRDKPG